MITSAGLSGVGSHERLPVSAICAARRFTSVTASRNNPVACSGVKASRWIHDAHGPSSIPPFRSTAQITTSRHAARYARMTLTMPDFPAPVVPPISACRRRKRTRTGWPSSDTPISAGRVMDSAGYSGPGDGRGVRVFLDDPQREPVSARGVGNDADAASAARPARIRSRVFSRPRLRPCRLCGE